MATGFDIDEEDYNWVDISEYADLDPTQRFTKRVLELGNKEGLRRSERLRRVGRSYMVERVWGLRERIKTYDLYFQRDFRNAR